jgi:alpha-amylase/alpha-mannosidase (GH57 family)
MSRVVERYICIHGHFYQPPRENAWLEAIELQDSAYPYHDWNERITAECYAPNSASRILDGEGRIEKIVNNYSRISFNFGPTLLSWLEEKAPAAYRAILEADQLSRKQFSGHGSAIAQAYNHMILPLANTRDKETQILWGIRDFEHRFRRHPEGMWLPETAVDLETLQILARHGIHFTVLAPTQAKKVRPGGKRAWRDVTGGHIDPSKAYELRLGTGRAINIFFYDGPISNGVAFEGLLAKGEVLADRMLGAFLDSRAGPQIVHIATDGETYGHHQPHGDMALAYALQYIEEKGLAQITNYGEFLEKHPPADRVQIIENASWSCAHGIERWREDCGCNSGSHPDWNQKWRKPLREALDWLRDAVAPKYEAAGGDLFKDPWTARNEYIEVILNRSPEKTDEFLARQAVRSLSGPERIRALKLLELQRHAMLMYTSCGWFFDEISGLETVQVLQYAGRVVQLSHDLFRDDLEAALLTRLDRAPSNILEHGTGRIVYEKFVWPAMLSLEKVGAHYAVSSLFEEYSRHTRVYCYLVQREAFQTLTAGNVRLAAGHLQITSEVTRESEDLTFAVVHLGDHNISGGVRPFQGEEAYLATVKQVVETFEKGELSELVRELDRNFGAGVYSLQLLFRDELSKVLRVVLASTMEEAEATFRHLFENHQLLIHFVSRMGIPLARHLQVAAELTLNADLRKAFEEEILNVARIQKSLQEVQKTGAQLDVATLEFTLRRRIDGLADQFHAEPADLDRLHRLDQAAALVQLLPFKVNLWTPQNIFYGLLLSVYPGFRDDAGHASQAAQQWVEQFRSLGEKLAVRVP